MDETIHEYAAKGEGFAFETTSGGRGYTGWILLWWERGYRVKLFFLRFPTPDMAVARVRQRDVRRGHDVSEAVVRRRFRAGWCNLRARLPGLGGGLADLRQFRNRPCPACGGRDPMKPRKSESEEPVKPARDPDLVGAGLRTAQLAG